MKTKQRLIQIFLAATFVLMALEAQASVVFTNLHSFGIFTNGAYPSAALVQGSDGNFYGTTADGGTNGGYGTVFKISTNGVLTSLYSFTGGNDGAGPSGLAQGSDGNFYGTTAGGGTNHWGTVFKITTNGVFTSLYSFMGGLMDGGTPHGLVQGRDGYFYGTALQGGTYGVGTMFKISTNGALTMVYSFTGGNNGAYPNGLILGSDGYFYGTTYGDGPSSYLGSYGSIFKISFNGAFTNLYLFTDGNNGAFPDAGLAQGSDGSFYGTAANGAYSAGVVFKVSTNGVFTIVYSFTGGDDGWNPEAGLILGSDGYFYGTAEGGGTNDFGTVFKISTNGVLTSLYSFTGGNDGAGPEVGLVQGSDGYLYGTTYQAADGHSGAGTVFKISVSGSLTTLYSFTDNLDGVNPEADLVQGSDGYFYGTTYIGGTNGYGTVFKISASGVLAPLYSFTDHNDGGYPYAGLVQGSSGYFYGTTLGGGTNGAGTVFKISADGAFTSLYSFGGNDGAGPAGLAQGSAGNFYGTTHKGGTNGYGTVFKISASGVLTPLYSFTDDNDGGQPEAGLVLGNDGYFYGTTEYGGTNDDGTVFKISANGAFTSLYSFTGGNDGENPAAGLVQGSDGNFYGTTSTGGTNGAYGTIFKITTNGVLTSLYSFTGGDGAYPAAGLVLGSDGNIYGTTSGGGTNGGYGTVFKITSNGVLTRLYSFTGLNDGRQPEAGLVQGSDGNFYGTTYQGGIGGNGVVFRISVGLPASPTVQLTANPTNGEVPLTVQFYSPGVDNDSNTITAWNWNFGDGGTSTLQNPSHTYTTVSTFTPNLVATNNNGVAVVGYGPQIVTTNGPPSVTIQPTNNSIIVAVGGNLNFAVSATGTGPFSYQWQLNGTNLPDGIITTVAGNGTGGYSGDGGAATNAELNVPEGVAVDASGNLFVSDFYNNRIRKVGINGIINTVAGNGTNGYSGDGSAATNAELSYTEGVAVDATGSLFIDDGYNERIRKVEINGTITTVAGNGTYGYSGDDGAATNAELYFPSGVAVDATGNLFIADFYNNRIREVGTNGIITTVAGDGTRGYLGDGGAATNAELFFPYGIAVDTAGNLFIADEYNQRVRKVGSNGIITTVAGDGTQGYLGDGGAATNAELYYPLGVAVDVTGNLFIADYYNNRVRELETNGIITTVAGNGSKGYFGDGGVATNAELNNPYGVAVDATGNLLIADTENNRIRKVVLQGPTLALNDANFENAGAYDVVVSSPYGSVTSSVVNVTITLPPLILSASQITIGKTNFTFLLSGPGGSNYVLQASTNVLNWSSVSTSTIPVSGSIYLTNVISGYNSRFYRAYLQ